MFARGNWSIFGVDRHTAEPFAESLDSSPLMLYWSEITAKASVQHSTFPAIGINPYDRPRLDDDGVLDSEMLNVLGAFRLVPNPQQSSLPNLAPEIACLFAAGRERYSLAPNRFAFWFCWNEWKDLNDQASTREDIAYRHASLPYRLLDQAGKRGVDMSLASTDQIIRRQFVVLIDFDRSLVFAETTNKKQIALLRDMIESLGGKTFAAAWRFGGGDWIRPVLAKVLEESRFKDLFRKRAEERTKLPPALIEKHPSPEIERILSKFLATTELETEQWLSLGTPSEVQLYSSADRVVAISPTNATILLATTPEALVATAQVTMQERVSTFNKLGEERTFRRDIYRFSLNDSINDLDIGVAQLRSFDLPTFRRDVAREKRRTREAPSIQRLWNDWLIGMEGACYGFAEAVQMLLNIEGHCGIEKLYTESPEPSTLIEEVTEA